MVIVMDMTTGEKEAPLLERAEMEFGAYAEEVMNAEWLPPLALRLEPAASRKEDAAPDNAEDFLARYYRAL